MTAFCPPPALYPRALTEIPTNADYADRHGSDKVAATQSVPMPSRKQLDGFLRDAYHNQLKPDPCNKTGCTAPTGGLKVGGLSCDNPENHGQVVNQESLEARNLAFCGLAGGLSEASEKSFKRWKLLCKACDHIHHKDVSTTM